MEPGLKSVALEVIEQVADRLRRPGFIRARREVAYGSRSCASTRVIDGIGEITGIGEP